MTDFRTRAGIEAEVLAQIREHGGFTIFWATNTRMRACAIARLVARGRIVVTPMTFPWSRARKEKA